MKKININIILILVFALSLIGDIILINHIRANLKENVPSTNENIGIHEPQDEIDDNFQSTEKRPLDDLEKRNMKREQSSLPTKYKIAIISFCILISLSLIYIIMSLIDSTFYKNTDRLIIYVLSNIILIYLLYIGNIKLVGNYKMGLLAEENTSKEEIKLDKNETIKPGTIELSDYDTDITITKGGTYELKGLFTNSIIIDADKEEIELVLAGVNITNEDTATIVGLSAKNITINLKEDTENTLTDGGNSKYDACIYSEAELIFKGKGKLTVNGNQQEGEGIATETKDITIEDGTYVITSNDDGINAGGDGATITINGGTIYIDASGDGIDSNKDAIINGGTIFVMGSDTGGDAGIDTDGGYTINGGTVIALGSDMLETPSKKSKQNTIAFTLEQKIDKNTIVTLMKKDQVIVSFEVPKSFKTLLISDKLLTEGEYELYLDGTNSGKKEYGIYNGGSYTKGTLVKIDDKTTFSVTGIVNTFGKIKNK